MSLANCGDISSHPLKLIDLSPSEPADGDVQIKVHYCGVCRTDLHIVEGDLNIPELPIIPGHQIVGSIESIGKNVLKFNIGDRVGVPWMNRTCGKCSFCTKKNENLCDDVEFTGLHRNGGYAEYTSVPQQFVYPLPEGISDEQTAPLLCAGIIGYRTLKLSGIKKGQKLGLYGFGASAHVTIQIANYWDCEVNVFTRSKDHQKHAEKLGAVWTGTAEDDPKVEMDASLIFAPAGWLMAEALKKVRKGGTVVSAGIHMTDLPEMPYSLLYGEKTLTSAANATFVDGAELLHLAAEIPIVTEVELYPLSEANKALADLKESKISGAGVLNVS